MNKPTEIFTETVENYIKYRPSYPHEIIDFLVQNCHLDKKQIIADVGSGTGFLAKLFLDFGNRVFGVEPNSAMREAGEKYLSAYPGFSSIDGSAEQTTLENQSVDFITAGTAFHWFNPEKTKQEFKRILKPGGWIILVWNVRDQAHSPMLQEYENLLLKYASEYKNSSAMKFNNTAGSEFFRPSEMKKTEFKHAQYFDWGGFKGRLLSTSYVPKFDEKGYEEMLKELKNVFEKYQENEKIEFLYCTKLYYGEMS